MKTAYTSRPAGSDQIASIFIEARSSRTMVLQQIGTSMDNSSLGARGQVLVNGFPLSPFRARAAAIGGEPEITLDPGETCELRWTGAAVGAIAKALVIWRWKAEGEQL